MGILYVGALLVGLGTIGLQFVLAHIGGGMDHDVDVGGADHPDLGGGDHGGEMTVGGAAALFLSMRFWTFGLLAVGLVGTALTYLQLCGALLAAVLAGGSGLVSGLSAAAAFRMLRRGVSSSETAQDAVGQLGRVLVACHEGHPGKVRIQLKGKVVDVIATSEQEAREGDQVLVVAMDDEGGAKVEPAPTQDSDSSIG